MRGRWIRLLSGLVLLGASVWALRTKFATVTYVATVKAEAPDAAVTAFHERFGAPLDAKLAATVEMPPFVYAGEARAVAVRVEDFRLGSDLENFLLEYYGAPEFTLTIPGVKVEPQGAQALQAHASAPGVWSVEGEAPGRFVVAMNLRLRPRDLTDTIARMTQDEKHKITVAMLRELPTRTWALELGRGGEPKTLLVKRRTWMEYGDTAVRGAVGVLGLVLLVPAMVPLVRKEA